MIRWSKLVALTLMATVLTIAGYIPKAEAKANARLELTIKPLECHIELVDDGFQTVVRVTPAVCLRAVHPDTYVNKNQ